MPTFVYVEFTDPATAEFHRLSALGINTLFGRWSMLPAEISETNSNSLNVEIDDYRGESDLTLLRNLRGAVKAGTYQSGRRLRNPREARREHYQTRTAAA